MREVITLQLGQLSNFAATHFWNAQEAAFTYEPGQTPAVAHDIHWRAGLAADGSETYLPRTVIYDLKGAFGSLRKTNVLYTPAAAAAAAGPAETPAASSDAAALWAHGDPVTHAQPQIPASTYQQSLDEGASAPPLDTQAVRYWSDYSRVYFHPRSVHQLHEYTADSTTAPFDAWPLGQELFHDLARRDDILDRDWRPFAEEADQLQAINVVASLDDAWGGFAAAYMEQLRDEFGKACIWAWGLQAPLLPATATLRQRNLAQLNVARSVASWSALATTLVPLAIPASLGPKIRLDRSSAWHTGALFAAAMESATLSTRYLGGAAAAAAAGTTTPVDLVGGLAERLNPAGNQPISSLRHALLAPEDEVVLLAGAEEEEDDQEQGGVQLSDLCSAKPPPRGPRAAAETQQQQPHTFSRFEVLRGAGLSTRLERNDPRQFSTRTRRICDLPLAQPSSFPAIFPGGAPLTRTALATDTSTLHQLTLLRTQIAAPSSGAGAHERRELGETLADVADAYRSGGWDCGSDEDDD